MFVISSHSNDFVYVLEAHGEKIIILRAERRADSKLINELLKFVNVFNSNISIFDVTFTHRMLCDFFFIIITPIEFLITNSAY